jgi:hypothetical protein
MFGQNERVIAGAAGRLGRDGDAQHGRPGYRDPVRMNVQAVQPVQIPLQLVAQLQAPSGVRVEGDALIERGLGGVADEVRGHPVPFPEPQRDDVRISKARKGDLGDAVLLHGLDFLAKGSHACSRSMSQAGPPNLEEISLPRMDDLSSAQSR